MSQFYRQGLCKSGEACCWPRPERDARLGGRCWQAVHRAPSCSDWSVGGSQPLHVTELSSPQMCGLCSNWCKQRRGDTHSHRDTQGHTFMYRAHMLRHMHTDTHCAHTHSFTHAHTDMYLEYSWRWESGGGLRSWGRCQPYFLLYLFVPLGFSVFKSSEYVTFSI